jgi:lipopolysaccharide/colanic/teichoic acid biosynthesis glycosyltransferase
VGRRAERLEDKCPEIAELPGPEWNVFSPRPFPETNWTRPGPWSQSGAKRAFDCACVLIALPLLIPVLLVLGLAVRLTSHGPVLFVQRRMGRHGKTFTILKFRTLTHVTDRAHHAVSTAVNQRFTPIGRFLRRWKLDELPQLLNVLAGQMSLVGPRPKLPEHEVDHLPCRPGITGAATIAFAREELILTRVPQHQLDAYYHALILPAKRSLDATYMAQATFLSDLKILANTVLRRWDDSVLEHLLHPENLRLQDTMLQSRGAEATRDVVRELSPVN